jgi:hypothetical protein
LEKQLEVAEKTVAPHLAFRNIRWLADFFSRQALPGRKSLLTHATGKFFLHRSRFCRRISATSTNGLVPDG